MKFLKITAMIFFSSLALVMLFQNCGQPGMIMKSPEQGKLAVCDGGVSCDLDPLTDKPAVTTILMALGDEANDQLVVNGASAQLIAETIVRYTSPKMNPRILVVRDLKFNGEDPEDTTYVTDELLKRYTIVYQDEPIGGLTAKDLDGFDIIWFNNPGHPMSSKVTRDTLIAFPGGVIIQGDDLSQGVGFKLTELTGLNYIDNGAEVVCGGKSYVHNNNVGEKYRVNLSALKFPQANDMAINFQYGNDIDLTSIAANKVEVMAVAKGGPSDCTQERPAIVRYLK